jgi:hypothetical protein
MYGKVGGPVSDRYADLGRGLGVAVIALLVVVSMSLPAGAGPRNAQM